MKKLIPVILFILFSLNAYAGGGFKKSGFFYMNENNGRIKYSKEFEVELPKDKIILIWNHGQEYTDKKSKDCVWYDEMVNLTALIKDHKVLGKEMLLYVFCSDHLQGDSYKKNWEEKKKLIPYKGKTKMDKRVEAIVKLTDDFASLGVPRNQIFLMGNSCGAWANLLIMSQFSEKVAGGIEFMPACYGWVSKNGIEKQTGYVPGFMPLRQKGINIIKNAKKLPVLVFTNPDDIFEGKTSYWLKEIEELQFIETPSKEKKGYFINKKKCMVIGNDWKDPLRSMKYPGHTIWSADCFQFYNSVILEYIEKRIKYGNN